MSPSVLLAEISAATALPIIHWVGVGFIFLWFLGSCMKDGLWDNGLRFFNAFIAYCLSSPLAVIAGGLLNGAVNDQSSPDVHIQAGIAIGVNWGFFLLCLLGMQTITDSLSRVKVAFHPVVNGIGSFFFICGITSILTSYCLPIYFIVNQIE